MLPKKFRLQDFGEIEKVKKEGKLFQNPLFGLLVLKRKDNGPSRFAFIVSLKISKKSTKRNKAKRLLSEALKGFLPKIKKGFDLVFLGKKAIIDKSFWEIKKQLELVLQKGGLINED